MKVFWSWQYDTPGNIGRHFVRRALELAIAELRAAPDLEEPSERDQRSELVLDHDRKGLTGSPDLAPEILRKISESGAFVADVTIVGTAQQFGETDDPPKPLINPNVAIEYGYAIRAIGDGRILMVQNTFFGDRSSLPFDLRHKAGPIQYSLAPNSSKVEIDAALGQLRGTLKTALRDILSSADLAPKDEAVEIPSTWSPGAYFNRGEELITVGAGEVDEEQFSFVDERLFYCRVIPVRPVDPPVRRDRLSEVAEARKPTLLSRQLVGGFSSRNTYGAALGEPAAPGTGRLRAITQLFRTGEIWAIGGPPFVNRYETWDIVVLADLQHALLRVISNSLVLLEKELGAALPCIVEIGADGLKGAYVGPGEQQVFGPIIESAPIAIRKVINARSEAAVSAIVQSYVDELDDLKGARVR